MLQLTNCWVFRPIDTHHREVAHLASPPKVEQGQAHDAHFLIRTRRTTADEASGVLAGPDLDGCQPARINSIEFSELTINTLRAAIVTVIGGYLGRYGTGGGRVKLLWWRGERPARNTVETPREKRPIIGEASTAASASHLDCQFNSSPGWDGLMHKHRREHAALEPFRKNS